MKCPFTCSTLAFSHVPSCMGGHGVTLVTQDFTLRVVAPFNVIGTLRSEHGDGSENVAEKVT